MGCQKLKYKPELGIYSSKKLKGRNGMYIYKYRFTFNGKEVDNDIYGEGNAYDFGARIYDGRLGRWFKPDIYESDYAPISCYTSFLNNPCYFRDIDGNKVIGIDGNDVTISYNGDAKSWVINGQPDEHTYKLFSAMLTTPKGVEAVKDYLNDPFLFVFKEVEVILNPDGKETNNHAETQAVDDKNNRVGTKGAGAFHHFLVMFTTKDVGEKDRMQGAKSEEKLNAIGVHEKGHIRKGGVMRDFLHHPWGVTNQRELVSRFQYSILHPEKSTSMDKWIGNYDSKISTWRVNRAYNRAINDLVMYGLKTKEEGDKLKTDFKTYRQKKNEK